MKRISLLFLALALVTKVVNSQESKTEEFKPSGKATGAVFWNYNYNLTEGEDQRNSFELKRTYLGYSYNFSKAISAKITLDGSKKSTASSYTVFVKNAQLDWKVVNNVKLSGGLIGTKQFKVQEKFLNYRYVYKAMQDEFKLGASADLGVNAEIKLVDGVKLNLFALNGEGYSSLQDSLGRIKAGAEVVFEPIEGLTLKGYYDRYGGKVAVSPGETTTDTASMHTLSFFAGYKAGPVRIGAEYDMQLNGEKYSAIAEGYDRSLLAAYGAYEITNQFEFFAEWANVSSNTLDGKTDPWNYGKDGNLIIAGLQYSPVKGVRSALNYQTFLHSDDSKTNTSAIYLNFEFKF